MGAPRLPQEIVDAVAIVLDREAAEGDAGRRSVLLTTARATIDGWRRGRFTTAQAVLLLRTAADTRVGAPPSR